MGQKTRKGLARGNARSSATCRRRSPRAQNVRQVDGGLNVVDDLVPPLSAIAKPSDGIVPGLAAVLKQVLDAADEQCFADANVSKSAVEPTIHRDPV